MKRKKFSSQLSLCLLTPQQGQCNETAFHKQLRTSRNICYAISTDDTLKSKGRSKDERKNEMVIRFLEIMVNLGLESKIIDSQVSAPFADYLL